MNPVKPSAFFSSFLSALESWVAGVIKGEASAFLDKSNFGRAVAPDKSPNDSCGLFSAAAAGFFSSYF
jgi:hypothetical protein